jgi:sigma-E factor negative regulatory protein RseB
MKAFKARLSCAVVFLLVISGSVTAAQSDALLLRMNSAFATQNYDGVFVYIHGSSMDTLRIVHSAKDGIERERIVRLDGHQQEIIRHAGKVTCVHGSDWNGDINHKVPEGPFATTFVRDMSELGKNYRLVAKRKGRVAGRDAQIFLVEPRDDYRYGYTIWLDEETGLLLKSILVHHGKVLERFQFTQLQLSSDIDPMELEVGIAGKTMTHSPLPDDNKNLVDHKSLDWRLDWLPDGFEVSMQGAHRAKESGKGVDTITYSDGMAAFSLFIEKIVDQKYEQMMAQKGATVAVTRIINYPSGDHLVTVVGEIPIKTAKRIVGSVVPSPSAKVKEPVATVGDR